MALADAFRFGEQRRIVLIVPDAVAPAMRNAFASAAEPIGLALLVAVIPQTAGDDGHVA